jgi:ribosomal protein L21
VVQDASLCPNAFIYLFAEPEVGDASVVMKVIKERFSKDVHALEENRRNHSHRTRMSGAGDSLSG